MGPSKHAAPSGPRLRPIAAATSATGKGRARDVARRGSGLVASRGCRAGPRAPWWAPERCSGRPRRPRSGVRTRYRQAPGAAKARGSAARSPRRAARRAARAEPAVRGARRKERAVERGQRAVERGQRAVERAGTIRRDGRHRARHFLAPGPAAKGGRDPAPRSPGWSPATGLGWPGRLGPAEQTRGAQGRPVHPSRTHSAAALLRLTRTRNYDSHSTGYSLYP